MNYSLEDVLLQLEQIHGIHISSIHELNDIDIFKIIWKEIANKRPVLVLVDLYWCKWFVGDYQNFHNNHYCIVKRISEENDIELVDSQMALNGVNMNKDEFQKGLLQIVLVEKKNETKDFNWKEQVTESIQYMKNSMNNRFLEINNLANDIGNGQYLCEEIDYKSSNLI